MKTATVEPTGLSRIAEFIARLDRVRKTKDGWTSRCPAHEDRNPSLSVSVGDGGRIIACCHAGCSIESIAAAIGWTVRDLFPAEENASTNRRPRSPRKAKRAFRSVDAAAGALLQTAELRGATVTKYAYSESFTVVRFDFENGREKQFRPIHKADSGWVIGDPPGLLPLFCVDKVSDCVTVHVVEGEKCACAGWSIRIPTVTSAHGSHAPRKSDWSPLAGKSVVILPDNDDPGRRYAETVAGILHELDCSVTIVSLPGLSEGGDIVDFIDARDSRESEDMRSIIETMGRGMPEWEPTPKSNNEDTEALRPRPALSWSPFPVEALPEPMRSFVSEGAAAIGCDPSMIALPTLAKCAGAIGTTRVVELKRGWSEPSILWPAVVAPSGTLKSPSQDYALRSLRRAQERRFREYQAAAKEFEGAYLRYQAELATWKKSKPGQRDEQPKKPAPPLCVRYVVSDCTIEALAPILRDNPRGLLLARDELGGWLTGFNQYKSGKGSDVPNWLELYRAGPVIVDRKTGTRTVYIPRAAVSVCGTIQPGTLQRALTPEFFECGLAARLLLAAPPTTKKQWTEREVPLRVTERFAETLAQLLALEQAPGPHGEPEPVTLRLAPDAKTMWTEWYAEWAARQHHAPDDRTAALLSKLEGGAARLALVCELVVDPGAMSVGSEAMRAGTIVARWFAGEAERVYELWSETPEDREDRDLVELCQRKGGVVTVRDLMRSTRRFATAEDAEHALNRLVRAGVGIWTTDESDGKRGRPARRFRLAVDALTVDTNSEFPDENAFVSTVNGVNGRESEVEEWVG